MYEKCLNEAERLLMQEGDALVEVKELWVEIKQLGDKEGYSMPSLADFTAMLEGDSRFDFMPEAEEETESEQLEASDELEREEIELEKMGFLPGDRVRLRKAVTISDLDDEDAASSADSDDEKDECGLIDKREPSPAVKKSTSKKEKKNFAGAKQADHKSSNHNKKKNSKK